MTFDRSKPTPRGERVQVDRAKPNPRRVYDERTGVCRRWVTCPECGYERHVYSDRNEVVCRKCAAAKKRNGREVECPECGTSRYFAAKAIEDGHRYCSYECAAKHGFQQHYKDNEARVAKLSEGKKGAKNPNWKGGKGGGAPSGRKWSIRLKGELLCRVCLQEAHHLHHIVPRSKSKAGLLEVERNGMPLCSKCHRGWHTHTLEIPSRCLTPEEYAFAVEHGGIVWVEKRYPGPTPEAKAAA